MSATTVNERDRNLGTWVVRVMEPPEIVCPQWCTETAEEHRAELFDQEGFVIHRGPENEEHWSLVQTTTPDGHRDPGSEGDLRVCGGDFRSDDAVTPKEVEEHAARVREFIDAASA